MTDTARRVASLALLVSTGLLTATASAQAPTHLAYPDTEPVYRRPAEAREIGLYAGLLDVAQAEKLDFDEALRLVLEAGLQAPAFLYHLEDETPEGGGWRTVRDHALANRLSYLVWQSAPDDELQALADAGALADPEILDEQVVRMLADERARRSTDRFVRDWFALDGLLGIARSDLDDRTAASLHESAVRTWDHLVWERQEALGAVLDSEIVMVDDRAAEWMGLDEVDDWQTTTLPEGRRGALTWPGVLAAMSDRDIGGIVARGLFVREHIQCLGIADPPEELDLSAFRSHLGPDATERDYSDDRLANSGCAGCHLAFDPLAYALLPFDGSGRELADPEPADGWVPSATADVVYAGPEEFASLLPTTIEVERCLVAKPLQFALGRPIESSDGVLVDQISEGLTTGTWSDTVRTIVSHPAFSIVATDAERP